MSVANRPTDMSKEDAMNGVGKMIIATVIGVIGGFVFCAALFDYLSIVSDVDALLSEVRQNQVKISDSLEQLGKRVDTLDKTVNGIATQVNDIKVRVDDIPDILKDRKLIAVGLYRSERTEDKGRLVLNGENVDIARLLQNGCLYQVTSANQPQSLLQLKSRLDAGMTENGQKTTAPVGRLYADEYYKLFNRFPRGLGFAKIRVTPGCDK